MKKAPFLIVLAVVSALALDTIKDGSVTIAAAGTAQPLMTTTTRCLSFEVQCAVDNAGNCFIGGSTIADGRGIELEPGQSRFFEENRREVRYDLNLVYGDTEQDGEILTFIYTVKGP